ncbi:MAG TPA: shikimate dehydrogenase [Allosphingosinicella sp.]|jgi:shikimate dehydrogenase
MGVPYAEVIGDPIEHSKSPLIHKFWLEKLGLEGDYRRSLVKPDELAGYLASRREDPHWRGCNVTMPHKEAVLPLVGELDPKAAKVGAVNTVVPPKAQGPEGFNTDARAIADMLSNAARPSYPAHVATYVQIIGAGGAARAAVIGAVEAGYVDFDFFNRTVERAQTMARWLSLSPNGYAHPLEGLGPIRNLDDGPTDQRYSHIVVNATSMGMLGNPEVPIRLRDYYPDTIVIDMAYGPNPTKLVRDGRALGLRVFDGLEVLTAQAAHAFRLFFGSDAPREHDSKLRELLTQ